jgi:C-terminal processing protease CtpA/Prc
MNLLRVSAVAVIALALTCTGISRASQGAPGDETHAIAGIGVVVGGDVAGSMRLHDHILITQVLDRSPASHAKIMAGDEIMEIDGVKVAGMNLHDAVQNHLRGGLGSVVKIVVVRPGQGSHIYDLKRDITPTEGK